MSSKDLATTPTAAVTPPPPDSPAPVSADPDAALSGAKPAVGTGSSPLVAQLIALALICLGVVGVEEGLVRSGAIDEPSWTSAAVSALDGIQQDNALVLVAGIVALLLGLLLLVVVFRRRPRRGLALAASTEVDLPARDLAKVAESLLGGAGAVTGAQVRITRRTIVARVSSGALEADNDAVRDDVAQRLEPVLDALRRRPRLRVKIRNESA